MRAYAHIELLMFQNKTDSALSAIKTMRTVYSIHSLTDELLWLEADIYKKHGEFQMAVQSLQEIVDNHDEDIWSDDAFFMLSEIYERHLNQPDKAMELYRELLTKYPGSVFVAEARKDLENCVAT